MKTKSLKKLILILLIVLGTFTLPSCEEGQPGEWCVECVYTIILFPCYETYEEALKKKEQAESSYDQGVEECSVYQVH